MSLVLLISLCVQDGSSPLLAAVKGSHDSIVKALLSVDGVDVNAATTVRVSRLWDHIPYA